MVKISKRLYVIIVSRGRLIEIWGRRDAHTEYTPQGMRKDDTIFKHIKICKKIRVGTPWDSLEIDKPI
jgi:hypothetical protein